MALAPANVSNATRSVPHRPFVPVALAALSGAALGPLLPAWLLVAAALAAPLGVGLAWREARRRGAARWRGPGRRKVLAATLVGVAGLLGLHARLADQERRGLDPARPPAEALAAPAGVVEVEGLLAAPPTEPFPGARSLLLEVVVAGAPARLVVEAPAHGVHCRPLPGARLVVRGRFATPTPVAAAGLRARGLGWRLQAADVREVAPGRGPGALLGALARAGGQAIDAAGLPHDQAAFLRAIVLGDRADLPRQRTAALRATGTAHLLSISGLHVTLLAGVALVLARAARLTGAARAASVVLAVVLYVGVSGPAVPVLRAAAAGVVAFSLPWRGDGWNRLAVGLVAALAWDPLCPWSIGTILSFGTVGLLLLVEPWLRGIFGAAWPVDPLRDLGRGAPGRLPARRGLAAASGRLAAGAVAAFLSSAPLVAWTLGDLPLVALVANPPAIALFGLALGLGAVGVVLGAVAPPLGAPLLRLAGAPVAATFAVIDAAAAVPGGRLSVPTAEPALAVLAAGLVALGAARRERRPGCRRGRAAVVAGAGLGLALVVPWPAPRSTDPTLLVADDGRLRRLVVVADGGALGLGPTPAARLRSALARSAGLSGARTLPWGPSASTGRLLAVPLVDEALVRVDVAAAAGPRRLLVLVDPRALLRGQRRGRLALLSPDALAADALALLGAPGADLAAVRELVLELARRSGARAVVADLPGLDPASVARLTSATLAAPDREGRVTLARR